MFNLETVFSQLRAEVAEAMKDFYLRAAIGLSLMGAGMMLIAVSL